MSNEPHRAAGEAGLLFYFCIVSSTIMCYESQCFLGLPRKLDIIASCKTAPVQPGFISQEAYLMGACDMVMIATHNSMSEWSVVKSRFRRNSGQTEQSSPVDFHAVVVRT